MDLVFNYMPDVFSYHSMRHYNYDNPSFNQRQQQHSKGSTRKCTTRDETTKDSCPICQEKQRRPLATYIRSKSRQDKSNDSSIQEEPEDGDNETQHEHPKVSQQAVTRKPNTDK